MRLKLNGAAAHSVALPCVVIPVLDGEPLTAAAADLDAASGGVLQQLVRSRDIDPSLGATTFLHRLSGIASERVLVIGFGKLAKLDRPRFDRACFAAGRALRNHPLTSCHVCIHEVELPGADAAWKLRQAALAVYRANYRYTSTKAPRDDDPKPVQEVSFSGGKALQPSLDQAAAMGKGYETARRLGDLPANICTPAFLAAQAEELAKAHAAVQLEILQQTELESLGMRAMLTVSRGSANPPRLIVLKHLGGAPDESPVVLIGKGITFDSGGLSLKAADNMTQMKYDMCGAAAVLGALETCVLLNLPINVICLVAAAENMPDGNAYRPGDVITSMAGKTIEVLNTDAEGRLVLCDALTYSERFNPRAVIDVATLTGACVVALGHHASGLMSNDDKLATSLIAAGDDVVDRAWRLPLWDDYQSQLDSNFADMQNVGGMSAGVVTAACFLSRFAESMRWAHLDIAGSAWKWNEKEGATGRPVGLLSRYLLAVASGETK